MVSAAGADEGGINSAVKIREVMRLIETDGWFLVRTRVAIDSIITRRNREQ